MAKKLKGGKKGRKYNRRKSKPCQQRYVFENRRDINKRRKAQKLANKFGHPVRIKVQEAFELVKPREGEKSPSHITECGGVWFAPPYLG